MTLRCLARCFAPALFLSLALPVLSSLASLARADESAAEAPKAEAPQTETPAPETPQPEPERISGKINKVDTEGKFITVLVEPERGRSGRAFRRYKLFVDDKSLILVDQQPSTIAALEAGQKVEVGFFKKGKQDVVDTVVVTGRD